MPQCEWNIDEPEIRCPEKATHTSGDDCYLCTTHTDLLRAPLPEDDDTIQPFTGKEK
jgi:hypothetical protein